MEERHRLVGALSDADVAALLPLVDGVDAVETEPRWTLLRGIRADVGTVLAALAPGDPVRLSIADLRSWISSGEAGSWATEVAPERAWALLQLLGEDALRALRQRLGWELPGPRFEDGLRRELFRRYGGGWPEIVSSLDPAAAAKGVMTLTQAAVGPDARSILGSWLVGRRVVVRGLVVTEAPRTPAEEVLLPPPPRHIRLPLNLLRITTIGDLVDLDVRTFRKARGAGQMRVKEFVKWREEVLGTRGPAVEDDTTDEFSPEDLADPLPEAPGLVGSLLRVLGVGTVGALLSLDPDTLVERRGVGGLRIAAVRQFQDEVRESLRRRRHETSPSVLPGTPEEEGEELPPDRLAAPLPEPPGLLRKLLAGLGVDTIGSLLAVDSASLAGRRGLGGLRMAALKQLQKETLRELRRPLSGPDAAPPRPTFADLSALNQAALAALSPRDKRVVAARLLRGGTLTTVGQSEAVSRERARQLVARALVVLRPTFGTEARRLLVAECGEDWLGGVIFSVQAQAATVPFRELLLALAITADGWTLVDEDCLFRGSPGEFSPLFKAYRRWVGMRERISATELEEAPGGPAVARTMLLGKFGFSADEEGHWSTNLPRRPSTRERLLALLVAAGKPLHQDHLARVLFAEDGYAEPSEEELFKAAHRVEGKLVRAPTVYRCGYGTFVHRDFLPVSEERLTEFADWCLDLMEGRRGVFDVRRLGKHLVKAGAGEWEVNPWVLKDVLRRRPEVVTLRKFQVAYAATFRGAFDRLEGVPLERG